MTLPLEGRCKWAWVTGEPGSDSEALWGTPMAWLGGDRDGAAALQCFQQPELWGAP